MVESEFSFGGVGSEGDCSARVYDGRGIGSGMRLLGQEKLGDYRLVR